MDHIEALNRSLFLAINGQDGTPQWLVNIFATVVEAFNPMHISVIRVR